MAGAQRQVEVPAGGLHLQGCDIAFPASYVDTVSMIVYDLHCVGGHEFEGWFSDAEDYEEQQAQGILSCPVCNSADVQKVPTASHIQTQLPTPSTANLSAEAAEKHLSPVTLREKLQRYLTENFTDVGTAFPEEARKIHYGEAEARNIRGTASNEEFNGLREEGVEVHRLPAALLDKEKLN